MKQMSNLERIYYSRKLSHYLKKHQYDYPEHAIQFLSEKFLSPMPIEKTPDILLQIYANFNMLYPEENYYLKFAQEIGEIYGWDCQILEIGGGFFPTFSKYVDKFQRKNKSRGTITTYDSDLIVKKLGNVKLYKEEFTEEMTVESYDLIVGILPCDATKLIIKKATEAHKEFFIAMCGCLHLEGLNVPRGLFGYMPISYDDYVDRVYDLAKLQEQDGFEVIKETVENHFFPYPVIRSKRK